ncbi:MAG TPA: zf-HC2 domain-containing protein [Pyrinomonadaceae bacterium]|nr:zf-HC2 domain-containing protein [Pyrinomonadaceae bacterium]
MDQSNCQIDQIASYLDDELDGVALSQFKAHLIECPRCRAELADQQRLLGTLNAALTNKSELSLPPNFARVVAAHAESDMSGMRTSTEHRRAFQWCAILAVASVALLGVAARTYLANLLRTVARPASIAVDLVWTTIYDAVTGLVVISRVISKGFVPGSSLVRLFGFLLLGFAVLVLSRLISNYHRTRLID